MAWNWPAKKDTPPDPRARREYPEDLDPGVSTESGTREDAPSAGKLKSFGDPPDAVPAGPESFEELTERLGQLGQLIDETRQQVAAYLLQEEVSKRLDALCEKLSRSGGDGGVNQMLDRIYGKLVVMADTPSRPAAEGASGSGPPPAGEAVIKGALRPLAEKLDKLAEKAGAVEELKNAFVPTLVKLRDGLTEQHTALGNGIRQVHETIPQYFNAIPQYFTAIQQQIAAAQQQLAAGVQEVVNILRPPQPEASSGPAVSGDWQQAILGPELAADPALGFQRQQLFGGVLNGEPAACGLAGTLLVFRSSPVERMPALLKDIGEAYYRWQPRTGSRVTEMERALVGWLQRTCAEAGINNVIELVSPGERFDASRHNATERGVEITQVQGWIVLRDNGKVYTKASVAVK